MRSKNILLILAGVLFCFLSVSLSYGEEPAAVVAAPAPKVAASDTNKDGKPDQWQYYEFGQIARTETDTNFDGKPDQWQYYENGRIIRTEADTNFDGKVDEIGNFSNGKLAKVEKDSDYDGKMDRWADY